MRCWISLRFEDPIQERIFTLDSRTKGPHGIDIPPHHLLVPIDFTDVATQALCDQDVAIGQLLRPEVMGEKKLSIQTVWKPPIYCQGPPRLLWAQGVRAVCIERRRDDVDRAELTFRPFKAVGKDHDLSIVNPFRVVLTKKHAVFLSPLPYASGLPQR